LLKAGNEGRLSLKQREIISNQLHLMYCGSSNKVNNLLLAGSYARAQVVDTRYDFIDYWLFQAYKAGYLLIFTRYNAYLKERCLKELS